MLSVLVLFALQQQPDEFLKQVEEKYVKAKTLSMTSKIVSDREKGEKGEWTVDSKFKEGNRFKMTVNGTKAKDFAVVCDGKKMGHGEPGHQHSHDAPADYGEAFRILQVRAGGLIGLSCVEDTSGVKDLKPADAKFAADEKIGDRAVKVVEYSIKFEHGRGTITIKQKIFVDAETLAILKREWKDDHGTSVTETNSDVKFDAEIADDTFTIK
jgi:outer membrane lipoprotein-sorting protein